MSKIVDFLLNLLFVPKEKYDNEHKIKESKKEK